MSKKFCIKFRCLPLVGSGGKAKFCPFLPLNENIRFHFQLPIVFWGVCKVDSFYPKQKSPFYFNLAILLGVGGGGVKQTPFYSKWKSLFGGKMDSVLPPPPNKTEYSVLGSNVVHPCRKTYCTYAKDRWILRDNHLVLHFGNT